MDRLVSKIIAGGLSAGVFLFWWPDHVAGEGLLQLVLRGLLWTLSFELLLLTIGPAEQLVARRLRERSAARGGAVRSKLAVVPAPARTGGVVAMACFGIAAPVALLADAPKELVKQVERPQVVKQVIVERPVVEKKIVVRRVVAPSSVAQPLRSTGAAPSVATSQVGRPAAARNAVRVAPERTTPTVTSRATKPATEATGTSSIGTPASATSDDAAAPAATPAATTPAP